MVGPRDAKWLKEQLSRVLGWDELIVEGLVDAVMRAAGPGGDQSELDEMVQNFLIDSPAGVTLIKDFLAQSPSASRGISAAAATSSNSKSYAASASAPEKAPSISNPAPTAPGAALSHRQQQQQKQQQPGRGPGQQQQPSKVAAAAASSVAPPGWQALRPSAITSNQATAAIAAGKDGEDDFSSFVVDDRADAAGGRGGAGSRSKSGSSRDLQALEASAAGADKPGTRADGGGGSGKVLGMFKAGGRIKAPAAKPVGLRGPDGGALAVAGSLERKVINCLGCGKIYDCRSVTNDILRFLDRGGICTFCGDTVPLSYKDRQKAAAAATEATVASAAAAAAGPRGGEDEATAAARAFKDRLVEYDRNAAKRTTVIDDQSDFFEIDTNAWLTDQEREELRRRRQLEEEAEAARRKRLTVTIDLIGRKVVVDDDVRKAEEKAAAVAAERAAATAKAAAAAKALRNTDGEGSESTYGGGVPSSGSGIAASAANGPTQEQLAAAIESLRRMKATANPAVAANAAVPIFLPTSAATAAGGKAAVKAAGGSGGTGQRPVLSEGTAASASSLVPGAAGGGLCKGSGAAAAGGAAKGGGKGGRTGAAATGRFADHHSHPRVAQARVHERVQHDLGAEFGFDAFGAEVALDELMGGALLSAGAEEDGPYDICAPDLAPSPSFDAANSTPRLQQQKFPISAALTLTPTPQRCVQGLPPGVVLLKGYLTMDEQIRIVREVRELGIEPAGFYVPSYNTGARLALQMMCLGLHWEPRTSKYEPTRSSFDGSTPPPIPQWLVQLCGRCLAAASASATSAGSSPFPSLRPDICLVNFYERSGRLGMHQDKDEMPDSLRAGLPVVSLSLGDAADFLYGRTRDIGEASSIRLESGDLLVFGGPGRMIYHSVAKIHPNTAPTELIRATGLRPGRLNLTFRQYRA